ncbi:ribonuclease III [Erysipelothrix piscisicarius]|uniref:Mini-ribonuclease 3 n=1 Tax=Erysipelothrix piscisicarius TaxID=2485784 RepID=A0A3S5HK64_9FIRM|nr:ribonuclease III domain-containing protein [Erysipelothrix piscisicarius]AZK43813.1 ribonuclease III [Erysipelothrix piscisicarius]
MMHSGNVLAFVGDAVLSLQVRQYLVEQGITKTKQLQETSVKFVSAMAQADYMKTLLDGNALSEEEMGIYKRGRNTKSASMAKNADVMSYRIATGFEALWGYLYMEGHHERLDTLWKEYIETVEI